MKEYEEVFIGAFVLTDLYVNLTHENVISVDIYYMSTSMHDKLTVPPSTVKDSNLVAKLTPLPCGNQQQLPVLSPRSKLAASRGWPPSNCSSTTSSSRTIDAVAPGTVASAREAIWGKKAAELTVCSTPRQTKQRLVSETKNQNNSQSPKYNSIQNSEDSQSRPITNKTPEYEGRTSPTTFARVDGAISRFNSPRTNLAGPSTAISASIEVLQAEIRSKTRQEDIKHDRIVKVAVAAPLRQISVPATIPPNLNSNQTIQSTTGDVSLNSKQDLIPPPVIVQVTLPLPQPPQPQKHVRPATVTPLIFTKSTQYTDLNGINTIEAASPTSSASESETDPFNLITPSTAQSLDVATPSTTSVSTKLRLLATPSSIVPIGLTTPSAVPQLGLPTSHTTTDSSTASLDAPLIADASSFFSKFILPFINPSRYFKSSKSTKSVKSTSMLTPDPATSPPPPSILAPTSMQKTSSSTPSPTTAASTPVNASPTLSPYKQRSLRSSPVMTKSSQPQTKTVAQSQLGVPRNKRVFTMSNPIHRVAQEASADAGVDTTRKLSLEAPQTGGAGDTGCPSQSVCLEVLADQRVQRLPVTQLLSQSISHALIHTTVLPLSQPTDQEENNYLHLSATSDRYRHLARPGPFRNLSVHSGEGWRKASVCSTCSAPSACSADLNNTKTRDDVDDDVRRNSFHHAPKGEHSLMSAPVSVVVDSPVESLRASPHASANGKLIDTIGINTQDTLFSTITAVGIRMNSFDTSSSTNTVAAVTLHSTSPDASSSTDNIRHTEFKKSVSLGYHEVCNNNDASIMADESPVGSSDYVPSSLDLDTTNLAVSINEDLSSIPTGREKNFSQSNPLARRQISALPASASAKTSLSQSQSRKSNSTASGSTCGNDPLACVSANERISSDKLERVDCVTRDSDTTSQSREKDKTKHYAKLGSTFAIRGNALSTRGGGNALRKSTLACN